MLVTGFLMTAHQPIKSLLEISGLQINMRDAMRSSQMRRHGV
jgi:hypothetical protein